MSRIHILGLGNIGRFYAHALSTSPTPPPQPITLLLHRSKSLSDFHSASQTITLETPPISTSPYLASYPTYPTTSTNYPIESSPSNTRIENLILATKAPQTVDAIKEIVHQLDGGSSILFTQNGLGLVDAVDTLFASRPSSERPAYLAAITTHGILSHGPFHSIIKGWGDVKVGRVPAPSSSSSSLTTTDEDERNSYLLDSIVAAPLLNATALSSEDLKTAQLLKLVINSSINPLTALLRVPNESLFSLPAIRAIITHMISNYSTFLQHTYSSLTPDSKGLFSRDNLLKLVEETAQKTAQNRSSMLQDVEAGRETEVEWINGWWVERVNGVKGVEGLFGVDKCLVEWLGRGVGKMEEQEVVEGLSKEGVNI